MGGGERKKWGGIHPCGPSHRTSQSLHALPCTVTPKGAATLHRGSQTDLPTEPLLQGCLGKRVPHRTEPAALACAKDMLGLQRAGPGWQPRSAASPCHPHFSEPSQQGGGPHPQQHQAELWKGGSLPQ